MKKASNQCSRPSDVLKAWIRVFLTDGRPGDRLPTDEELARRFLVSARTVARVFDTFRDTGRVTRIPGKGTFIPVDAPIDEIRSAPPKTAAEMLVDHFSRSIRNGSCPRGRALPQIKFVSRSFKVSPATVSKAYHQLEALGYVSRVGRSFWVGGVEQLTRRPPRKIIGLLKHRSTDFNDVFTTDTLSCAYRRMEDELLSCGYSLRFDTTDELAKFVRSHGDPVERTGGLVFFRTNHEACVRHLSVLAPLLRESGRRNEGGPQVLFDWEHGATPDEIPGRAHILLREYIPTSCAQAAGAFIAANPFRAVTIFADESAPVWNIPARVAALRVCAETAGVVPDIRLSVVVQPAQPCPDRTVSSRNTSGLVNALLPGQGPDPLRGKTVADIRTTNRMEDEFGRELDSQLWIFSHAAAAGMALAWCAQHRIALPRDLSMVVLENQPACYHLGISAFGPDWERIGCAMAHAVAGILPVEKTRSGFVKTQARFHERSTTR